MKKLTNKYMYNKSTPWIFLFTFIFISYNVTFRWLRWLLFHSHGAYGWEPPSIFEYAHLLLSCTTPVAILLIPFYILLRNKNNRLYIIAFLSAVFITLVATELDMSWHNISGRHISYSDIIIFLTESWKYHIGLQTSDTLRFITVTAYYLVSMISIYHAAVYLAKKNFYFYLRFPSIVTIVIVYVLDITITSSFIQDNRIQWLRLSEANPFRITAIDTLYKHFNGSYKEIDSINEKLKRTPPISATYDNTNRKPRKQYDYDVVIITIEGLNEKLSHLSNAIEEISKTSIVTTNHYSSGDATHYGILGITHAEPLYFYGDSIPLKYQSKYIALFNKKGYLTKRFGADVTVFGQIGKYVTNFTEETVEPRNDKEVIKQFIKFNKNKKPKFSMIYYFGTHWPYSHSQKYDIYIPTVEKNFDYTRWNLLSYKRQIINTYKNALLEMNDWLEELLNNIDLNHTIVAITGDHGEEMFEQGRLSHAGGLWEPQIRTPLIIHTPDNKHVVVHKPTSHNDILPTITDLLGWDSPKSLFSNSILSKEKRFTISVHNNHTIMPVLWSLQNNKVKLLFKRSGGKFEVSAILDKKDNPIKLPQLGESLDYELSIIKALEQKVDAAMSGNPDILPAD